ncbi:MAG: hypothetical protein H0V33_11375, partial [Acidimicrobiia bacterium]|nr:hypothetical protein [Acidimicrobiia bacterium]
PVPAGDPHPLAADGPGGVPDRRPDTGDVPALVVLDGGATHGDRPTMPPVAARRDPGRRLLGVAAAVLLIAALTAGIITRPSGDSDEVEFADAPPITASTTVTTSSSVTATTSAGPVTAVPPTTGAATGTGPVTAVPPTTGAATGTEPVGGPTEDAPTSPGDAVLQFVTALAEGDGYRADALLGDASRAYMASFGTGVEDLYESLYAAWGRPDVSERQVSAPVLTSSGEGTLYVVVLRGNIGSVEGGPPDGDFVTPFFVFEAADAGTYRVDIYPRGFDDAALAPELVQPALGDAGPQPLERGDAIRFEAPAADEAYVSIDGGPLEVAELVDGTGSFDPGAIDTGLVSLVVVAVGGPGVAYEAAVVEVVTPTG